MLGWILNLDFAGSEVVIPSLLKFPHQQLSVFDATTVHAQAKGFHRAGYDPNSQKVVFYPWGQGNNLPGSVVLSYDTTKPFAQASSYEAADWTTVVDPGAEGFGTGTIDPATGLFYFPALRVNPDDVGPAEPGDLMMRYDAAKSVTDPTAYTTFDITTISPPKRGWAPPFILSGYLYCVPLLEFTDPPVAHGVFLRYNTAQSFTAGASWEFYDLQANVNARAAGFQSGAVHAPYVYLIPFGVGESVIVRYDTRLPFNAPTSYETFDIATLNANVKGPTGGLIVNNTLVIVPWRDLSIPGGAGIMSTAAAFDTTKSLSDPTAWAFIDLLTVNSVAEGYLFGFVDANKFVHFTPHLNGLSQVPPFVVWDSKLPFGQASSWQSYPSAGIVPSVGAAYRADVNTAWLPGYGTDGDSGLITQLVLTHPAFLIGDIETAALFDGSLTVQPHFSSLIEVTA